MIADGKSDPPDDLATLQRSPHGVASWKRRNNTDQWPPAPALASYRNLVQQFPAVSQLWAELGLAAAGDLDFALAHQASQRAAELASADASLLVAIGQQCHRLRRLEQASVCFRARGGGGSFVGARAPEPGGLVRAGSPPG